jgi:hypothetical protein
MTTCPHTLQEFFAMSKWRSFGLACLGVLGIGIIVLLAWDNRQLRDENRRLLAATQHKQMAGLAMLGPNDAKTKLATLLDARKQTEQAMKELLDEDQYKLCQDYEATIGERAALNQINQAFTEQAMTLDDAQQEELITVMVEEREKLKIPTPNEQQEAWANGIPSDAAMEKLFQQQETLNIQVYERSAAILSDAQRNALKEQQDQQRQMQKLGFQMFKRLMGGDKKE